MRKINSMNVIVVGITPSYSFGEYKVVFFEDRRKEKSESVLKRYKERGKLYELGVDKLPDDVEDIRGSIHYEPDQVFAIKEEVFGVTYFGWNICNP